MNFKIIASLLGTLQIYGCAVQSGVHQLNEPSRSITMANIANLREPQDIRYEIQRKGDISVGYNMTLVESGPAKGIRLTLFFRNEGIQNKTFKPSLTVVDPNGFLVPAITHRNFVEYASLLAGAPVPPMPNFTPVTTQSSTSGTIRNTATGSTYQYDSDTNYTSGAQATPVDGVLKGIAMRQATDAAANRDTGRLLLRWANTYWLRDEYSLQPGTATGGVLYFQAVGVSQLPLKLKVAVASEVFEFTTKPTLN